jgi:hypothetical protein
MVPQLRRDPFTLFVRRPVALRAVVTQDSRFAGSMPDRA